MYHHKDGSPCPKGKERAEHSSTVIPSDSRVPEDVLREHSVSIDDDGVLLLRCMEPTPVEERDQILGDIAVSSLPPFRLLAFLVVPGE